METPVPRASQDRREAEDHQDSLALQDSQVCQGPLVPLALMVLQVSRELWVPRVSWGRLVQRETRESKDHLGPRDHLDQQGLLGLGVSLVLLVPQDLRGPQVRKGLKVLRVCQG